MDFEVKMWKITELVIYHVLIFGQQVVYNHCNADLKTISQTAWHCIVDVMFNICGGYWYRYNVFVYVIDLNIIPGN